MRRHDERIVLSRYYQDINKGKNLDCDRLQYIAGYSQTMTGYSPRMEVYSVQCTVQETYRLWQDAYTVCRWFRFAQLAKGKKFRP